MIRYNSKDSSENQSEFREFLTTKQQLFLLQPTKLAGDLTFEDIVVYSFLVYRLHMAGSEADEAFVGCTISQIYRGTTITRGAINKAFNRLVSLNLCKKEEGRLIPLKPQELLFNLISENVDKNKPWQDCFAYNAVFMPTTLKNGLTLRYSALLSLIHAKGKHCAIWYASCLGMHRNTIPGALTALKRLKLIGVSGLPLKLDKEHLKLWKDKQKAETKNNNFDLLSSGLFDWIDSIDDEKSPYTRETLEVYVKAAESIMIPAYRAEKTHNFFKDINSEFGNIKARQWVIAALPKMLQYVEAITISNRKNQSYNGDSMPMLRKEVGLFVPSMEDALSKKDLFCDWFKI